MADGASVSDGDNVSETTDISMESGSQLSAKLSEDEGDMEASPEEQCVALAGATEPKNKALMSTMDPEFFLESYPWWGPIFERFGIGRGGQTSMLSGLIGDGSGACDSGCSVS